MRLRYLVAAATVVVCGLAVAVAVSANRGSAAANANDSLFAALAGKNERPKADRDGRGSFSATFDGNQICYGYVVKNIGDPVAAHIHKAPAGKNGDVVVSLGSPGSGDPGSESGCGAIDAALKKDILRRPANYYVNVHNVEFQGGAVRGQLFAKSP